MKKVPRWKQLVALMMGVVLGTTFTADAGTSITFNGTSYTVPAVGDASWGVQVSNYLTAIASGALQKTGGSFTLTAETDFGSTYGLRAPYFKSKNAVLANSGVMRMGTSDALSWRNAANNADLPLLVNSSNVLTFNGNPILTLALGSGNAALQMNSGGTAYAWQTLTPAGGGTGLTSGTSGGINYWSSSSTMASSGALTANAVVIGGGAGAAPSTIGAGTADQVLVTPHLGGAPTFGQVDLSQSAAVKNQLPVANGGTGLASGTSGGVPYFSGSTTIASSAALTASQLIVGGGAGAAPATLAAGSQYQVLTMGASTPAYGAVALNQSAAISGTLGTGNGGTGVTSVTTSPTASAFAGWDANKNLSANSHLDGYTTTATAAGTTTLTVASTKWQYFTGTTTQTVVLPVTSTLALGQSFKVVNSSSGVVTVQSSGANTVQAMAASSYAEYVCISTSGTGASSWSVNYSVNNAGGGTVTSVAATVPTGLAVSGSPITTNGTLGFTWSGTIPAAQVPVATTGANGGITLKQPTQQAFTTGSGTYTTPAGVLWIRVRMVGGGGGGAGGGTNGTGATAGGNGGDTTFGTTLLAANHGTGGATNANPGSGGTASLGSGPVGIALTGATGGGGTAAASSSAAAFEPSGGMGGSSPFGGAGGGGASAGSGSAAVTNSGSGGGGGGCTAPNGAILLGGGGGGAGGFVDAVISSPSASYSYAIGAAGSAGTAGTSGSNGGAGGSGYILVEEHYY